MELFTEILSHRIFYLENKELLKLVKSIIFFIFILADFGVSVIVKDKDLLSESAGTYHFMAPEALQSGN